MKLNEIKRLCLRTRTFHLVNAPDGTQWLGDGFNLYRVEGIQLTEHALPSLFGLTVKQFNKCSIREINQDRAVYNAESYVADMDTEEESLYYMGDVWAYDQQLLALRSKEGLMFLPLAVLKPTVFTDDTDFRLRDDGGRTLIAVWNGMFVDALVAPVASDHAGVVVEQMQRIAHTPLRGETTAEIGEEMSK